MPTGGNNGLLSNNQLANPYTQYDFVNRYEYDPGMLPMPLSGSTSGPVPQATTLLVQVRRPQTRRIAEFEIVRIGDVPEVPKPLPQNANEVLLEAVVTPIAPVIQPDGNRLLYRVKGRYVFAVLQPVTPGTDPIRMGKTMADIVPSDSNLLSAGNFTTEVQ
jgi:hypothetical protein